MGASGSACCGPKKVAPPSKLTKRTADEVRKIINEKLNPSRMVISDNSYGSYSVDDLKRFLKSDDVDKITYKKDSFDCDNFALVLAGREAEWFSQVKDNVGSTFGMVHGDIRKKETDTEVRAHAINFLIDDKGELWLIEPQTDGIFKPTKNSTFWFTYC